MVDGRRRGAGAWECLCGFCTSQLDFNLRFQDAVWYMTLNVLGVRPATMVYGPAAMVYGPAAMVYGPAAMIYGPSRHGLWPSRHGHHRSHWPTITEATGLPSLKPLAYHH